MTRNKAEQVLHALELYIGTIVRETIDCRYTLKSQLWGSQPMREAREAVLDLMNEAEQFDQS